MIGLGLAHLSGNGHHGRPGSRSLQNSRPHKCRVVYLIEIADDTLACLDPASYGQAGSPAGQALQPPSSCKSLRDKSLFSPYWLAKSCHCKWEMHMQSPTAW